MESDVSLFPDKLNAKSGEQVNIEVNLETPEIANSSLLVIITPLGSELVFKDEIIYANHNSNNNNFYYLKLNKLRNVDYWTTFPHLEYLNE